MPSEATTETRFLLEAFLPLWVIAVLGVALFAFAAWQARRDARTAERPKLVRFFIGLRVLAVCVLLWMLAGPTLVTVSRLTRPKSVAILVDHSASMGLVDLADGSGNVSRWSAARDLGPQSRQVRDLDEAISALRAAQNQLERFSRLANTDRASDGTREAFSRAVQGIQEGLSGLNSRTFDRGSLTADQQRSLDEAGRVLGGDGGVLEILRAKASEFSGGKTLVGLDRESWLPALLTRLATAVGQLDRLADQTIKALDQSFASAPTDLAARESRVSRLDKVEAFLSAAEQDWLKDLRQKATVNRYEFGEKVIPLGPALWEDPRKRTNQVPVLAPATQLGTALRQIALDNASQPVTAAILITDGAQNAGTDPRELAPALAGTALHLVPIGNTRMQRDVILHHTHAPKAVLQNDQVVVDSIVTAYDCEKEKLRVELLDNDTVVDGQTFEVAREVFDARVQLRWKASQLGRHTLSFRVVPVADERSGENNAATIDLQVMEDHLRVFVADNFPRWETRYLLNLFKRDERVDFEQLLFEPQITRGTGVRTSFPKTVAEWSKYRVVILGDVLPTQLTAQHQQALRDYVVEAGGNLILIAGGDAMPAAYADQPLGTILPVQSGDRALPANNPFYLHLTDEGSMTLATQVADSPDLNSRVWREMSERLPIYALNEFSQPRATAHSLVWASTSKTSFRPGDPGTRSFLAWHYLGAGRVVYVAAPITYQLRYRQGDTFHHRFWGQLLRWAVARDLAEGSRTVRLSTDKSRYEAGDPVEVSVRLAQLDGQPVPGAALQVGALQDGHLVQGISVTEDTHRPGTYHGVLEQLPVGPVKIEVSGDRIKALLAAENYGRPVETTVHVDPSGQLELRQPLCNLPLLREIADASRGIVVPPTGLKAALAQLNLKPEILENISKKPLWNRWDLFWIFIACLSLEWAGRKYVGLS